MDQVVPPSTPTRRSASTSNLARRQGEIASANSVTQASQSTPLSSSESHIPAPLVGDTSSSGEGSIVLHSVSDRTSASGLESSFEAIHLGTVAQHSTDSSLEIIVHSSPATTGFLAFSESQPSQNPESSTASPSKPAEQVSGVTNESRHSRQTSLVAIDEKKPLAILSPVAHTFAPAQSTSSAKLDTFEKIVAFGKDELGHLTPRAKEALARLGLKPVPSLHGPLNLPYARCASGIDAFVPNDDPGGEPWGEDEPDESRHQRTQPIPLPGNSRYTLAGRLAMRYSSAPAALENGNKRSNQTSSTSRTAQASIPKFKKPSHANRPLAAPQPRKQQQRSTGATGARSASSSSAQAQEAPRDRALHQVPNQFDLDVQAFARAQAMQNLFLQHAQMAQALGGGQQLSPSYQSNQTGSSNSSGGWPRAQSPYLPPFQPFTPPLLNTPHPSGSRPSQLQPSDQVDSLTLLKLAGQRQLGLNPTGFPIAPPQINLEPYHPISYESDDGDDSDSGRETEPLGGRQAEDANSIDSAKDYDRSAVAYAPVGSGTPAYTGYDFLRRASAQETRASGAGEQGNIAINRRNSAFTHGGVALPQQSRGPTAPNPAQETRRRRSAAPAVPYPGHSHRKASTSSIVTVNSTVPGPVPQVRIFSDSSAPPVPPASSAHRRRSMVATGRPLEDVVNAQPLSVDRDQKHARATTSPAEASTNWRRTSLPTAGEPTADAQEQVSPPPSFNAPPASRVEAQTSRGRGRGARGRKRGGRGGSRTRGGQYANASQNG